jgi:hypothetical protein
MPAVRKPAGPGLFNIPSPGRDGQDISSVLNSSGSSEEPVELTYFSLFTTFENDVPEENVLVDIR